MTVSLTGCGTFVAYTGPALPDEEVATIHCFWRYYFVYSTECHISAIDGQRPEISQLMSLASKLKPGNHWIEFGVEHYFGGGGGTRHVCAFDFDFEAGHRYQIKAHSFKPDAPWMSGHLYTGTVAVEAVSPAGQSQKYQINTTCSFGGGSLCRKTSDCVPHPDIRCIPQEGFSFGMCHLNN